MRSYFCSINYSIRQHILTTIRNCIYFSDDDGQCNSVRCAVWECTRDEFLGVCLWFESSMVDLSYEGSKMDDYWTDFGDPWTNDDEFLIKEEDMVYVDLSKNPERFTGYSGHQATRIWSAIYKENCFMNSENSLLFHEDQCVEKQIFYKIISGLHASISVHLTYQYPLDVKNDVWAPNVTLYMEKVGSFPERIENLYLTYLIVLRSLHKFMPYIINYNFYNKSQSTHIKHILQSIQAQSQKIDVFDESLLFNDISSSPFLKSQIKSHFRNISVILDCVTCERCKLWGKLQINGLGAALKILFDFNQTQHQISPNSKIYLTRTEIVALFNLFRNLSYSIHWINHFNWLQFCI